MNYLAHAYLSFGNPKILLGNMISDFVKGKQQFTYPPVVHKGIVLHRAIDDFTDTHAATKEAKQVFKSEYGLYSGAFMDVAYDHFLATNKDDFANDETLLNFSQHTYRLLDQQESLMPDNYRRMFYYMKQQNWLYGYRTNEGIYQSFGGLVKRAAYLQDSTAANKIFEKHYDFLAVCFAAFWLELKPFAHNKLNELLSQLS